MPILLISRIHQAFNVDHFLVLWTRTLADRNRRSPHREILPLNFAVGYLATSKSSGPWACSFRRSFPKSSDVVSTAISTVPDAAVRSSWIVPVVCLNLPRQTDSPPM